MIFENKALNLFAAVVIPLLVAIVLAYFSLTAPEFYEKSIQSELGVLEASHVLIPAVCFVLSIILLFSAKLRADKIALFMVIASTLANLYVAGEEASWGQHFFGWEAGETWQEINDQQETNLHNTSAWFDQKPRMALEIFVIGGGLVIPILLLFKQELANHRLARFFPTLWFLPTALLAEVSRLIERTGLMGNFFFPTIRYSEIQEFYFYYFVLLFLILMMRRLR